MKPETTPALSALVDQAEAHLRDWLSDFPAVLSEVRGPSAYQRGVQMVSIDVLAALSEVWQEPIAIRLDVVTARLLAWDRLSRG